MTLNAWKLLLILLLFYRVQFQEQINQLRTNVEKVISDNIKHDMNRINSQILDTISPYSRHVRIEKTRVQHLTNEFTSVRTNIRSIQDKIQLIKE